MRGGTKLWLIMLVGAVGSTLLFLFSALQVGKLWNDGYDLKSLQEISRETLHSLEALPLADKASVRPILEEVRLRHPSIRFEWIASDGTTIYDTAGEYRKYDFRQSIERLRNMPERLWETNDYVTLAYAANSGGEPRYLLMGLSGDDMKQGQIYFFVRSLEYLLTLILPILLSFLVPYLLSLWYFSSVNRRVRKLNDAMNRLGLRGGATEIRDSSKDEIGQLSRHFNSMAIRVRNQGAQIEQFEERRRMMLSNLSHDLRTPLTMMLGYAETIRSGLYKDENELQESAKIILQRSRYMDKLLDQLLDISKLHPDAVNVEIRLASCSLSELARKVAADYLLFLDGQDIEVEIDVEDTDIEAVIDASLLERALRNLLDNAIRHGREGNYLGLSLTEDDETVLLSVTDKGKGIPSEDYERIFERFYRGDGARKGDGLGIGLSIVKQIAEAHAGTVTVESVAYGHTVFSIRLPKTGQTKEAAS